MTSNEYAKFAAEFVFESPDARIPTPGDKGVVGNRARGYAAYWEAIARREFEYKGTPMPAEFEKAPQPIKEGE